MIVSFTLNGSAVRVEVDAGESMLPVLRRLRAKSVKDGCSNGDCGSCAILVDGRAVNACLMLAAKAEGAAVRTVEGLALDGVLHPLQVAMLDHGATQCGFCVPGMLMATMELLAATPQPSLEEIRQVLAANLCRCTGYAKQLEAVIAVGGG